MNQYQTSDMNLATVLSLNFPIRDLINENGRGTFYFDDSAELQDLVRSFWNKELSVEPQVYFDTLKSIKNRLYSEVGRRIK